MNKAPGVDGEGINEAPPAKRRCRGLFKTMRTIDQSNEVESKVKTESTQLVVEEQSISDTEVITDQYTTTGNIPTVNAVTTTTAASEPYSNNLAVLPNHQDVIDVLGLALQEEVNESKTKEPDGMSLIGAYGDCSSSDDDQDDQSPTLGQGTGIKCEGKGRSKDDEYNNSGIDGGSTTETIKPLDDSLYEALKTNKHIFKDFDIKLLHDVDSRDHNAEWKLDSNLTPEERQKRLSESVWDKTMSGMFTNQTTSGAMKAKHQIGWLAADVHENEDDLRRRGAEAREHKKRAQQRYGW